MIPSCEETWDKNGTYSPRIYILEIKDKEKYGAGDPAIARLLVEREEVYERNPKDGSIESATIRITYTRIQGRRRSAGDHGYFDAAYWKGLNLVSLSSHSADKGAIFLDLDGLLGQRIGTFLMNEIVGWVKQWPEAEVRPIELLALQGYAKNKGRRNRFYEQFGIKFKYTDGSLEAGIAYPMRVAALTPVETWKENLAVIKMENFMIDVVRKSDDLKFELDNKILHIENLLKRIRRAEEHPIRWVRQEMWSRHRHWIIQGSVVTAVLAAIALQIKWMH